MRAGRSRLQSAGKAGSDDQLILAPALRRAAVLEVIGSARRRLILSMFRCDDVAVLDSLADALARKVRVEVLVTPRAKGWQRRLDRLWLVLEGMGATLYRYPDPVVKYHAKYLVADSGPALVASFSLTTKCFSSTVDFALMTCDRAVVAGLTRLFEADRVGAHGGSRRRLGSRLIVGPERAREQLTRLLAGAKRSILVVDPKVTDPAMVSLLRARQAEGVSVKVLARGVFGDLSAHGKAIVVDRKSAVIGSMSLSALSLEFRREVAVRIDDPGLVSKLVRFVSSRAAAAPPQLQAGMRGRRGRVP